MKISKFMLGMLAIAMFASCSDKKEEGEEIPEPSGEMEVMTPEKSKEHLQQTATDFLDLFKPADQKSIMDLAAWYSEEYGKLDMPDNFYIDDEEDYSTRTYLNSLAKAASGDMDALTRASYVYTYKINFNRFAGVYEPNRKQEKWVKTANSSDVIFRFPNKQGGQVELKVTQSGGTSELEETFVNTWYEYIYDSSTETEDKTEFKETYNYFLSIPKTVNITLTDNGTELSKSTVVSSIDVKGHTLSADVNAKLCNLTVVAKISGTDSKVSANVSYYMDGNSVATAQTAINGHDLCNRDKYEELSRVDDDDDLDRMIAGMIDNGECVADVLGKVQLYGNLKYYSQLPLDLDCSFESYDYKKDKEAARKECRKVCDSLNKNLNVVVRYDGTKTDQASLLFAPNLREWGDEDWWYYYPEALVSFPDGTTYSIDSYFESFSNVSNKFESLIQNYEKMWNTLR